MSLDTLRIAPLKSLQKDLRKEIHGAPNVIGNREPRFRVTPNYDRHGRNNMEQNRHDLLRDVDSPVVKNEGKRASLLRAIRR
jgi:hypothetical protein